MTRSLAYITTVGLLAIMLTACSLFPDNPTSASHATVPPLESEFTPNVEPASAPTLEQTLDPITEPTLEPIIEPTLESSLEPSSFSDSSNGSDPSQLQVSEATLLAVGDIMVHMPQLPAYYNKSTDRYDLSPWFSQVKPLFLQADWVIGNLETPIAGKDLKYSGFPRFNAPYELVEALVDSGVDLVSTANNHALDRGIPGIERTLKNLKKGGLTPVGTASSAKQKQELVIVEKKGIRMGFLAYTYGTNGVSIPDKLAYVINFIDLPKIKKDIKRLKEANVDIVTVSLHFGQEYQRLPNTTQTDLSREIIRAGGDIILGSHPHVVQPYEEIHISAAKSMDGQARKGIVIYSMGNFISNQTDDWKDVGLLFGLDLIKVTMADGSTTTTWKKITTEPTWVHILKKDQKRYYTIIPMKTALATKDTPILTDTDYRKMEKLLDGINKHLLTFQH